MGVLSPIMFSRIKIGLLILAEKSTSLAVLRTGIAVLVSPLSVASLLIVTSKYYNSFSSE